MGEEDGSSDSLLSYEGLQEEYIRAFIVHVLCLAFPLALRFVEREDNHYESMTPCALHSCCRYSFKS
jgi:hypothetical protein